MSLAHLRPSSYRREAAEGAALARRPLRALLVEDNDDDAAMVLRMLRRSGYEPQWERVQTADALQLALSKTDWEVVLSDYALPQFDALRALRIVRERVPLLPFIIISGSIGEETAVAAMRAGANDYVMKTNLARLAPALERELHEAHERSARIRAQKELHDLEGKFQAVFQESLDIMLVLDPSGCILHVNRAVQRIMGHDEQKLVGRSAALFWPDGQRPTFESILSGVRREGFAFHSGPLRRRDGSACPMDLQASKVPWGASEALIFSLRDVSERQRAQQRLADEKEQLAVTLRSIGDGVITTDKRGRVVLINAAAERLTGWSQRETQAKPLAEVLPLFIGPEAGGSRIGLDEVLLQGTPASYRDVQTQTRPGERRRLALKAAPTHGQENRVNGMVVIFRDTTADHTLEEELQKASRWESVALTAGGIAHDFNNILTAILGHLSLARTNPSLAAASLASVEKACLYATDLTKQLLSFSRETVPVRRREDLATLLREGVEFSLHGSSLRGQLALAPDLAPVEVDRAQILQVINNLVINAAQATPSHGTLRVTAYNVLVDAKQPVVTLQPGRYVCVTFADEGVGIAPENLARIFDPYFTTKPEGNGLGLATSYSILRKHQGLIRVESEPGRGTAFSIYLPSVDLTLDLPKVSMDSSSDADVPTTHSGRILFMDDEEMLQELVGAMLNYLGYEVVCAANGEEALSRYATGAPFDAVIVDLTVPGGMGGHETVQKLRELHPQVKAIVSSGYSNDPIMTEYRQHGFDGVIAKPYQLAELSQVLQQVITPR